MEWHVAILGLWAGAIGMYCLQDFLREVRMQRNEKEVERFLRFLPRKGG